MTLETDNEAGSENHPDSAEVTPGYRNYVLVVLVTVYVFNFIDRQILAILEIRMYLSECV